MKTEVTQYQWFKIMGANPANFKNYVDCEDTHIVVDLVEMCPNNPVEQVSWNDV